jgi:hypothetical protein
MALTFNVTNLKARAFHTFISYFVVFVGFAIVISIFPLYHGFCKFVCRIIMFDFDNFKFVLFDVFSINLTE